MWRSLRPGVYCQGGSWGLRALTHGSFVFWAPAHSIHYGLTSDGTKCKSDMPGAEEVVAAEGELGQRLSAVLRNFLSIAEAGNEGGEIHKALNASVKVLQEELRAEIEGVREEAQEANEALRVTVSGIAAEVALLKARAPVPGPPGTAGPKGKDGSEGTPGKIGAQGTPGRDGPKGEQGETGTRGAQGDTGADGAPGAAGEAGAPGPIGPPGKTGPPGPKGVPGDEMRAATAIVTTLEQAVEALEEEFFSASQVAAQLIAEADKGVDGVGVDDGRVSYEEFLANVPDSAAFAEDFHQADADDDGYVTYAELQKYLLSSLQASKGKGAGGKDTEGKNTGFKGTGGKGGKGGKGKKVDGSKGAGKMIEQLAAETLADLDENGDGQTTAEENLRRHSEAAEDVPSLDVNGDDGIIDEAEPAAFIAATKGKGKGKGGKDGGKGTEESETRTPATPTKTSASDTRKKDDELAAPAAPPSFSPTDTGGVDADVVELSHCGTSPKECAPIVSLRTPASKESVLRITGCVVRGAPVNTLPAACR